MKRKVASITPTSHPSLHYGQQLAHAYLYCLIFLLIFCFPIVTRGRWSADQVARLEKLMQESLSIYNKPNYNWLAKHFHPEFNQAQVASKARKIRRSKENGKPQEAMEEGPTDEFLEDDSEEEEEEEEELFEDPIPVRQFPRIETQNPFNPPLRLPLLQPFLQEIQVNGRLHLALYSPLHSFSKFAYAPLPSHAEVTDSLRVTIRKSPPSPMLLTCPVDDQGSCPLPGIDFFKPPCDIEEAYCLKLPLKIKMQNKMRNKFLTTDLIARMAIDLPEADKGIFGIDLLVFEIFDPNQSKAPVEEF